MEGRALKVSLILVAHRSSAHLPGAADSFRTAARAAAVAAEVVLVEQSESAAEVAAAEGCQPDRLLVRPNRGYAAGVNAGVEAAAGDVLLVGNPDLRFAPGSLAPLFDALDGPWSVVGPQFHLGPFLFPPADRQTPAEEALRRLAAGSRQLRRWVMRREIRRWRRVWESRQPVEVRALSGALLAVSAETARRLGPWDEGYFLYFEETDWLRRARRQGLRLAQVPRARVEHAWGHAGDPAVQGELYERAAHRFWRKHHPLGHRLFSRLPVGREQPPWPPFSAGAAAGGGEVLWLLSPSPLGFPAAGARLSGSPVEAVEEFLARASRAPGQLVLTAFDPAREALLGSWSWAPPAEGGAGG